ncbi:MAG: bifunctional adenosylcobinamide kinase/adenosylcobinamide-phosphate guanylyltransferase [Eggerthellaceae bacterium]|nr:bifunctional adenosylcobinamide kinase/adenosylcobinamide-phosphate guanylyltransferase [Eggerthellaceae bacterium]
MLVLVTGGASSGKSAFAEDVALSFGGRRVYLATMRAWGQEGLARVARHREMRAGKGFTTVECARDLSSCVLPFENATVLLEDLGNLVANELFADDGSLRDFRAVLADVVEGVMQVTGSCDNLVVVMNEVGCDGGSDSIETATYLRLIGSASCELAASFDAVVEVAAGVPSVVKGALPDDAGNKFVDIGREGEM